MTQRIKSYFGIDITYNLNKKTMGGRNSKEEIDINVEDFEEVPE